MTALYSEKEILDNIALFDKDYPLWNSVLKSGFSICINISDKDLGEKLIDPDDPIFLAYNASATMKVPIALEGYFTSIKGDLTQTIDKPRSIFVLDIEESIALNARNDFGVAIYSTNNLPENVFTFSYYFELEKDKQISLGWKGLINFDKPLSNSLVITDNYYFANDDSYVNRGFTNLTSFIDAFLPDELAIEYHVTIFAEDCDKSNEWWVKEFGRLVASIKLLRKYDIKLELILTKSIHKRTMISNYVLGKTDQGYDIFHAKEIDKVKFDNDFGHYEILSDLSNSGTKHFQSATNTLTKLGNIGTDVCALVQARNNTSGKRIFGCNPDKTIKNRLLN